MLDMCESVIDTLYLNVLKVRFSVRAKKVGVRYLRDGLNLTVLHIQLA